MSKFIFVTGGVCSSLGKGVAASSVGSLLECSGLSVAMMKCDPYINVDAGNISPYQHGEVYVTDDGAETDLDLGNYSRFTSVNLTSAHSVTTGKIYEEVIKNERAGKYNGRTVQVIPHITDEIKRRILQVAQNTRADVVIVEIGGTVGDIESVPFLEAARQLIRERGKQNALSLHLTLVPVITGGELKTKPTQHSVKIMQEIGIQPDILLCRSEVPLDDDLRRKIALFCNVEKDAVFASLDVEKTIYELPLLFHEQQIDGKILSKFGMSERTVDITPWKNFVERVNTPRKTVTIGMIDKRTDFDDCYKSIREALFHAATGNNVSLVIKKINAELLEASNDVAPFFEGIDGIIVPGNYGQRGFLGIMTAIAYAREQKIPYLGIDFGMQLMAIEVGRNLLHWEDADSTEFMRDCGHPLISLREEQSGLSPVSVGHLGRGDIRIEKNSLLASIYGVDEISERHRNKYEFNMRYAEELRSCGLLVTALSFDDQMAEAFEWKNHPWGVGVQYHPEFISRPTKPHPLFAAFIGAVAKED